jgi:hypothetical protein
MWITLMFIVISKWTLIVMFTSPIWGTLLVHIAEQFIKPRFVPQTEIARMARQMVAEYGPDCYRRVSIEEYYAWHRCDTCQQAIWRRVRQALRQAQGEGVGDW